MEELLKAGDYEGLASFCEEAELSAPNGVASAEVYGTLLALYMLQNELDHAKLLWQRIPRAVREGHGELAELWEIGKRLWRKEFASVYELAENPSWPPHLTPLVPVIVERVRVRVVELVGRAYSTILISELCTLMGQTEATIRQVMEERGWEFDTQTLVCKPKAPPALTDSALLDQQQKLKRLTNLVSFLEN